MVIFSVAILGATRSIDMRRAHRSGLAAVYARVALIGLVLAAAIVVYGLILLAHK